MAEVLLKGSGRLLLVVLVLRPSQMSVSGLLAALSRVQWRRTKQRTDRSRGRHVPQARLEPTDIPVT